MIAEAVGGDYFTKDTFARISMASGAPAILGWKGHEDQWRSGNCKACAGRFEDVNTLYTTTDTDQMRQILDKYGVTYVYVGDVERRTYGDAGMDKFTVAARRVSVRNGYDIPSPCRRCDDGGGLRSEDEGR